MIDWDRYVVILNKCDRCGGAGCLECNYRGTYVEIRR